MKTESAFIILLLALPCIVFARKLAPEVEHAMAYGAEAEICLKVCDDMGAPVTNASVCAGFDMLPTPHSVYGKTDTNGVCVVRGITNGNKVVFLVCKDGYYGSRKEISYVPMSEEHDVRDGKWQPYGAIENIELRKIRNPQKLVACSAFFSIPSTNALIGFDMEKKSFVKPFGSGDVSDIEICAEWDGLPPWESCYCQGDMLLGGVLGGGYYVGNVSDSYFPYPYVAERQFEYQENKVHIVNRDGTPPNLSATRVPFRPNSSLVIRTRCILDENGNLKSANYGRINDFRISPDSRGLAILSISYIFNPTPNDPNLEDIETAERSRHFIRQCEPPPTPKAQKRKSFWQF